MKCKTMLQFREAMKIVDSVAQDMDLSDEESDGFLRAVINECQMALSDTIISIRQVEQVK